MRLPVVAAVLLSLPSVNVHFSRYAPPLMLMRNVRLTGSHPLAYFPFCGTWRAMLSGDDGVGAAVVVGIIVFRDDSRRSKRISRDSTGRCTTGVFVEFLTGCKIAIVSSRVE